MLCLTRFGRYEVCSPVARTLWKVPSCRSVLLKRNVAWLSRSMYTQAQNLSNFLEQYTDVQDFVQH